MEPFHPLVRTTPSGCWEWTGLRDNDGYGRVRKSEMPDTPHRLAHRVAYQMAFGPIPAGAVVCHTCDNPPCCNPAHLWLGDDKSNHIDAALKGRMRGQDQTHCVNGHEFTPGNTYHRPGSPAGRDCRACIRKRVARYQARRRAAA